MKPNFLLTIFSLLVLPFSLSAQVCTGLSLSNVELDLGSSAGIFTIPTIGAGDIVNAGTLESGPLTFDIFNIATGVLGADGTDDVTIEISMTETVDLYGGITEGTTSGTHEVDQSTSGIRGTLTMGSSGATDATTGDHRCYSVSMTLDPSLKVTAEDFTVLLNSVNTVGEAYESSSTVFLDINGNPFGSATYTGYYSAPPTGVPGGTNPPTVASDAWVTTGTGVYVADNNTVDITDPFFPVGGTSSSLDGFDPNAATEGGLAQGTLVGGVIYTVCLEDVAATANDGDITSTSTSFTSTFNGFSLANVCFGDVLLGAELNEFTSMAKECKANLNWSTLSEVGLTYFEVERSYDGFDFRTVASIKADGDEAQGTDYAFTDKNAGELAYYRLKMVDSDESINYSEVLVARSSCNEGTEISNLYPIPAANNLTLEVQSDVEKGIIVEVFSTLGQQVILFNQELMRGQNEIMFPVNELTSGMYFLQVITDGEIVDRKSFMKR